MPDDPRDVLKAAGVECAEVDRIYVRGRLDQRAIDVHGLEETLCAIAQLAAKYKWQREIQVVGALDYNGAIARLDELWETHLREQHE